MDAAIAEHAAGQLGLVTAADLAAMGVSRQRRRTLTTRGVLTPVHRGHGEGLERAGQKGRG